MAHWFVAIAAALRYRPQPDAAVADVALVTPPRWSGEAALVPLQRRLRLDGSGAELYFEFRRQRFVFDAAAGSFAKRRYPAALPFAAYAASRGLATPEAAAEAHAAYGANSFAVPPPPFGELLAQQLSAPFFVFQLFCCALWALDEMWYYSLLTLGMLILFEATVAKTRQKTAANMGSGEPQQALRALRLGTWRQLDPADLLPGDVVSVCRPRGEGADRCVLPCDLLLLAGSAITEEAILTGESAPQWKAPAPADSTEALDLKRHRGHVLFGGTRVVQHGADAAHQLRTTDGGCLAVVLRTGFGTEQGKLMRTILFPSETVSANSREAGAFILLLLVPAIAAAAYVLHHGLADPRRSRWKLFLHCTMIITSVIPPELPMELTIACNTSLVALAKAGIFCTEPFRIPLAGRVDVCAFDKTGTLTSDELVFEGVSTGAADADTEAAAAEAAARPPLCEPASIPTQAAMCLGACHALVLVDGTLAGDPLERAALQGAGWSYAGSDVASPARVPGRQASPLRILRRLHFDAELRRMLVVAAPAGREAQEAHVLVKGAPEAVLPLCAPDSLPPGVARVYAHLAARGARVLALATRPLPAAELAPPSPAWRGAGRAALESQLRFAGLALFRCPVRASSAPALAALRRGRHATIMLTGDAPLTACHVARETHIVTRKLLLLHAGSSGGFEWASPEGVVAAPYDAARLPELAAAHDLCVCGDGIAAATAAGTLGSLVRHVQVYARCAPDQKEAVLKALRLAGLSSLMCGDGTNDCGALKAAAVGIALVAAPAAAKAAPQRRGSAADDDDTAGGRLPPTLRLGDASRAAPFTAKVPSVAACVQVVRQGRAALTTSVQMFKILGLNCLVSAFALSVQYLDGVKWGDSQQTAVGVASALMFMMLALARPAPRLAPQRPHATVFCGYALGSVAAQAASHLAYLFRAVRMAAALEAASGIEARPPDDDFAPGLVNSAAFLASAALQLCTFAVNYVGAPFSTPLTRNRPLFASLLAGYALLALAATGAAPALAEALQLVPLPPQLRRALLAGAALDLTWSALVEAGLRATLPARASAAALRLSPGV